MPALKGELSYINTYFVYNIFRAMTGLDYNSINKSIHTEKYNIPYSL